MSERAFTLADAANLASVAADAGILRPEDVSTFCIWLANVYSNDVWEYVSALSLRTLHARWLEGCAK